MELEDYGISVRVMDSYSMDDIDARYMFDLPISYNGSPCTYAVEFEEVLCAYVTISDVKDDSGDFAVKATLWSDGETWIASKDFARVQGDPKDIRPLFIRCVSPLLAQHQSHFAHPFRTHFNRLAHRLDLAQFCTP